MNKKIYFSAKLRPKRTRYCRQRIQHHGRARPDMAAGCHERLDIGFVAWILGYPLQRRPALLRRLEALREQKQVTVLRSAAQARTFLDSIGKA